MPDPTRTDNDTLDKVSLAVLAGEVRALTSMVGTVVGQINGLRDTLAEIQTDIAVDRERIGALQRKDEEIDRHIEATDKRVEEQRNDKRGLAGFWSGLTGLGTAIGALIYALMGKHSS